MTELRILMDPWNPGQFYACCGLIELFDAVSWFDVRPERPRQAEFTVKSSGELDLATLLREIREANYVFDEKVEKSVRPVVMEMLGRRIKLDWWLDPFYEKVGHLKCWAGQMTTEKLVEELKSGLDAETSQNWFGQARMMKSRFGIDPRSAWSSLGMGFSPNEHGQDAATFPAVELLGAVGLQGFRPDVKKREAVSYFLWRDELPRIVARRAARVPWDGLAFAEYEFSIAKRGQSYKFFTFGRQKE